MACNELSCIGSTGRAPWRWSTGRGDAVRFDGAHLQGPGRLGPSSTMPPVKGEDFEAQMLCAMATVALNGKTYYEEKHDKATFVKNINLRQHSAGDIYVRAMMSALVSLACPGRCS